MAEGLAYIDQHGVVHRDIKPSNILVCDGTPHPWTKILDMGLARLRRAKTKLTRTGEVIGTLEYLAPERVLDESSIDIRADLYSLGCVLFELLAGRLPWLGSDVEKSIQQRMMTPPPSLVLLRPTIPLELDILVASLLAPDPAKRPQTPSEVIAALHTFAEFTDEASKSMAMKGQLPISKLLASVETNKSRDTDLSDTRPLL